MTPATSSRRHSRRSSPNAGVRRRNPSPRLTGFDLRRGEISDDPSFRQAQEAIPCKVLRARDEKQGLIEPTERRPYGHADARLSQEHRGERGQSVVTDLDGAKVFPHDGEIF